MYTYSSVYVFARNLLSSSAQERSIVAAAGAADDHCGFAGHADAGFRV